MGLYGNQDKVSATLPALKPLPKAADYDAFEEWRRVAINDMVNTGGMDYVVTRPCDESLALAIQLESAGRSEPVVTQLWKTLHLKACSVLKAAFRQALGNTPEVEAEQEQTRTPGSFIVNNANWLWEFALKQFVPDHVGRITKALKTLQSLQFTPSKMTPSEYNTSFRAAINEIRAADPTQNFTEKVRLAFYLKGWPAELNQKLDLVKADAQPTVELAQRHLQQWFNDHGKKARKSDTNPAPTSDPITNPNATVAALKEVEDAAKKKFRQARQRRTHAEKKAGPNPQSEGDDSEQEDAKSKTKGGKHALGIFTERKLATSNPFAALQAGEDDASEAPAESLGAVSADGREFINVRNEFLLDSGASRSVVYDYSLLKDPEPLQRPIVMNCAMGKGTVLQEFGTVQLSKSVALKNVCHAKGARLNAMSVSRIADTGYYSVFGKSKAIIVKMSALDAALRRIKPCDIALTVPRVGDIYQYNRHGTGPAPDAQPPPALEVNRTGSIPLKGNPNANRPVPANKGKQENQARKPSVSFNPNSTTIPSNSTAASVPRARAQSAAPAAGTSSTAFSPSSYSSSSSSSSSASSPASLHAMTIAATLSEFGLPPDTDVEVGEWYSFQEADSSQSS